MRAVLKRALGPLARRARRREPPPPPVQVKTPIFSIGIYTGPSPLALSQPAGLRNPVLTAADVTDVRAGYVADPFMLRVRGTWYMYFEVVNLTSGRGEIALAVSGDGMTWEYKQIVLSEPFHLSYPYVFEWEGEYYMVPESYQAQAVRLYKAVDFPLVWSYVADLITGDAYEDSSLFRFDDRWWMLNDLSRVPYYAGTLRLFCAEQLLGPWTEHPMSPIVDGDPHIARPAGRVLVCNDRVIRFAQDCCPVYGIQVRAFELTGLTPAALHQRDLTPTPMLQGSGEGWNAAGMHHVDVHRRPDDEGWIACVDGWYWKIEGEHAAGQAQNV